MAIAKTGQTSFGAFNELFQYTYADVIIKILDSVDDVEKWIDSINFEDWHGGDSRYQLYKTAEGSGSRFVAGGPGTNAPVLPVYNSPGYSESTVRLFPHMDIVEITGPKLMRAHEKPGMYRQIMDEIVSDAKDSHRNRIGPKYWWGGSGALAAGAAANPNSGVLALVLNSQLDTDLTDPGTATDGTRAQNTDIEVRQRECETNLWSGTKAYMNAYAGARYFRVGQQVAIGTAAQFTAGTAPSSVISAVNQTAQTIQLADQVTISTTAMVYIVEGDANGTEWGNCVTGLHDAISDTGTYHGIDRATTTPWQSFMVDNGNVLRDFNHFRITSLLMRIAELGPKDIDEIDPVIFSHSSMLQVYLQEIDPVYMQTDLKALKGHTTIAYQYGAKQIPWETARSHPLNSYHVLDRSAMKRVRLGEYGWDTSTGSIWKQIPGTFAFQAFAYNEFELVCENPRTQGKEEDVRVPTGLIFT
tara:strand:- start:288 stop:1703 length:1416 start_codon:yes stop_codon:yes gene_type:complete